MVVNGISSSFIMATSSIPHAVVIGDVYRVDTGAYATVEDAVAAVYTNRGTNMFTKPATILVAISDYTAAVNIGTNLGALMPTASNPLIIRGESDKEIVLSGGFDARGIDHLRLIDVRLHRVAGDCARFEGITGAALGSCIANRAVIFTNCPDAVVIGNTFDFISSGAELQILDCTNALLRNNILLNSGSSSGWSYSGPAPDSGWNCYWPTNGAVPTETNSISADPLFDMATYAYAPASNSPAIQTGSPVSGFNTAYRGVLRNGIRPCIGAWEY